MNRNTVLGIVLFVIGILVLAVGLKAINSSQSVFALFSNMEEIYESKVVEEEIISIDIRSSSPSVSMIPSNRDDILIELNGEVNSKLANSFSLDVKTSGEKLTIYVNRKSETIRNIFGTNIINVNLDVFVPEKIYNTISITTSSGKISISDMHGESFDLTASSGSIDTSNISAEKELHVKTSSGRIEVTASNADSIDSRASSGAVTFNDIRTKNVRVATSSGKIELNNVAGEIKADASSGRITINNEELLGNIHVSTSSGRVDIRLNETPSAVVDFKGSSGKGSVNIPGFLFEEKLNNQIYGNVGSGEYTIKVRTSSGGFDLY
ncbi:DUF4097 family beta strand repeat-containing protein [Anaerobacillus sp. MEB173]|uniref:DUF4097 family beta strand repeat-containing protein n=1 Tax=Anaerobacillus sp. MEB173 TaxID=3383345 RepID=UPI003F8F8FAD